MSHIFIRSASQTDTNSAADGTAGVPTKGDMRQRYNIIIKLESQIMSLIMGQRYKIIIKFESRIKSMIMSYICHTYSYEQQVRLTLAALLMAPPV